MYYFGRFDVSHSVAIHFTWFLSHIDPNQYIYKYYFVPCDLAFVSMYGWEIIDIMF